MKLKGSYDFYLILATTMVLFAICLITIYGMFYFKFAQIQQMAPAIKISYMDRMNMIVAPFVICLILLLGICVPKRLLPTAWLNRVTVLMVFGAVLTGIFAGVRAGIFLILGASLFLQLIVLVLALAGSRNLNFQKKGYWVRLGSSLIHLGLILFVFDMFLYERRVLHLFLFWFTTGATVTGMMFCFYAETVVGLVAGRKKTSSEKI